MNTIKILEHAHDNAVRCAIALASPMILKLGGVSMRGKIVPRDYRGLFPSYIFDGVDKDIFSPAFVHTDSKLQGKKRIYVNANGYRMFYMRRKVLMKYKHLVMSIDSTSDFDKMIEPVVDRWIVMSFKTTTHMPYSWDEFVSRVVLAEREPSKGNRPPTTVGGFVVPKLKVSVASNTADVSAKGSKYITLSNYVQSE